jgi:hypothetical protein
LILTFKCWWVPPESLGRPLKGGGFLLGGSLTYYAWAMGGGVDYRVSSSLAIRTGADNLRTAFFRSCASDSGPEQCQDNRDDRLLFWKTEPEMEVKTIDDIAGSET